MFKKFSMKTNFIVIGVMIGLFIGIGIKQVLGDAAGGEVRSDNLTVNMGGATNGNVNGLIVAYGNALVEGNTGIGTTEPSAKLDVRGDVSLSSDGKAVGLKMWSGNLVVLDKVGIGVANPVEKLDVQGDIRSSGAVKAESVKAESVCIGGTCINETQLKAMMSGGSGGGAGGGVTPGTMTGTGTSSDPYICPFTYTVAGGGLPTSCLGRSDVKDTCCQSGNMTSCEPINGGVSIVGNGCHYIPPSSLPQKHLEAAVDHGLEYIQYAVAWQGAANRSALPVGSDCGGDYEFYHDPITVSGVPNTLIKFLSAEECGNAGASCFQGHRSTQACK